MEYEIKNSCTIVSGAPEDNIDYMCPYLKNTYVIAADSGYIKCEALSVAPDLILGDFDSAPVPQNSKELIVLPTHKDDTDTLFAIKEAIRRGFNAITLVGAIGNRFDHSYANVVNLDFCRQQCISCQIITANSKIFIADEPFTIPKGEYKYFSLFAFGGSCSGLTIDGAVYALTDYLLTPDTSMCQSNEVQESVCTVSFKSGKLLVVLSNDLTPAA